MKYLLSDPMKVSLEELVPVFHRFIQDDVLAGEMMIDVANYAHVHHGPGVMLVCGAAHYAVDIRHGRPGVYYSKKRTAEGSPEERLASAFRRVLTFAEALAQDPATEGRYSIDTASFEVGIMDRLLAPNVAATDEAARPSISRFVEHLYATDDIRITGRVEPREPYLIRISVGRKPSPKELIDRLSEGNGA